MKQLLLASVCFLPIAAAAQSVPTPTKNGLPSGAPAGPGDPLFIDQLMGFFGRYQDINGDVSGQHITPPGSTSRVTLAQDAMLPCEKLDHYGADPTGATYSDAAWDMATAIAGPASRCIQPAAGTYKFMGQISWPFPTAGTSHASVRGTGEGSSVFYWPNSSAGLLFQEHSDHQSFRVEGLTLLTGQAGASEAIVATNDFSAPGSSPCPGSPYHSSIQDVSIQGYDRFARAGASQFWKTGVHAINVSFLDWDGLNVTDADPAVFTNPNETGTGMLLEGSAPGSAYPSGCLAGVFNGSRSGYWNLGHGITIGTWSQGYQLDKLNFTLGQFGIDQAVGAANNDELTVDNSQFNTARYQVFLQAGVMRLGMHGNTIFVPDNGQGLYSGGGHDGSITGNQFIGILFGGGEHLAANSVGVHLVANDSPSAGVVTGNTFKDLTYGVDLEAGASGWNVQSNGYANVTTKVSNAGSGNTVGGGSP